MRILIGTDSYYPHGNGVSYFTQRLARGLIDAGHEVLVIAPSEKFRNVYSTHDGIRIFGIRSVPILFYEGFRFTPPGFITKAIEQAIVDFKPDVVHVQSHFFISRVVFEVAKSLGLPVVGTNHFMPDNFLPFFPVAKDLVRTIGWQQFKKVFDTMDAITTPTESAAALLEKVGFKKPVQVISNGIDLKRFSPGKKHAAFLKKYRIPADVPSLLFVGRIDKDKQIDVVLRALARALVVTPMHFVIAGKGTERANLIDLADALEITDAVTFSGFVPDADLPELYRSVDIFITASAVELQSIVALEAMATGLPIIAADAVALPELAQPGRNGFLFEPNDIDTLAKQMVKLAADRNLRERYGKESLKIVQAHSFDQSMEAYQAVYRAQITKRAAKKPSA